MDVNAVPAWSAVTMVTAMINGPRKATVTMSTRVVPTNITTNAPTHAKKAGAAPKATSAPTKVIANMNAGQDASATRAMSEATLDTVSKTTSVTSRTTVPPANTTFTANNAPSKLATVRDNASTALDLTNVATPKPLAARATTVWSATTPANVSKTGNAKNVVPITTKSGLSAAHAPKPLATLHINASHVQLLHVATPRSTAVNVFLALSATTTPANVLKRINVPANVPVMNTGPTVPQLSPTAAKLAAVLASAKLAT